MAEDLEERLRAMALEEAAKVADEQASFEVFEDHRGFCRATAKEIARRIRSLAKQPAR